MNRLNKLQRMSRRELAWRVGQAARIHRDRLVARVRVPRWSRAALLDAVTPDVIDPVMRTHIERGDWTAANRSLARALRARPRTFVLGPSIALELREQILRRWPNAASHARARADRLMSGRYDVLGYSDVSYTGPSGRVDWHLDPVHGRRAPRHFWADVPYLDPEVGDHKVTWELNRHQHWLALGRALWLTRERRYGWEIVAQLEDWLEANPPLTGINWASMLELGLRSLSWIWALHFLLADSDEGASGPSRTPWLVDLLVGLHRQLRHIEENLSYYFSPNTHLLGEALALYVAGVTLPELAESKRWRQTGRRILLDEIERQIGADGGHVERSAHYHRYTLDFYLLALLMAERSQDIEAITRFTDAVTRMAEFARAIAQDDGRLPLLGDDDGGMLWPMAGRAANDVRDSLALAAVVLGRPDLARWGVPEEVFWIAGRTAIEQEPFVEAYRTDAVAGPASATFADTGYVVARDAAGGHMLFDVGPHGFLNGGHAHADALAVTLAVNEHPLLIDPGTSTYTTNAAIRDRMRSSTSHNTLTLDRRSAAVPAGPFHWQSRADAQLGGSRHNPAFDWAEAAHDGYGAHQHRRTVFRAPAGGWLIVDEVLGRGRHVADLHWHFDPSWTVRQDAPGRLRATDPEGGTVWIVHDAGDATLFHGDEASGLGWFAPVYGTLLATWTARVSRTGIVPYSVTTWIAAVPTAPSLLRLSTEYDPAGSAAVGIRVLQQDVTWTTVLRPGEPPARETRGCAAGLYHTNGRLLHYGSRDGRLVSLSACDASHVLALREGWLSVTADETVTDLYVEVAGEAIDIWSSTVVAQLRLQGALVRDARAIRVNGRDVPEEARDRADSVVVLASYFGEPRRIKPCAVLPASLT